MTELMNKSTTADHSEIIDHNFTGELRGVRHNYIIADLAVMGNMAICHYQAVGANDSLTLGCSSAVNGDTFAQSGVVPDNGDCVLTLKFQGPEEFRKPPHPEKYGSFFRFWHLQEL